MARRRTRQASAAARWPAYPPITRSHTPGEASRRCWRSPAAVASHRDSCRHSRNEHQQPQRIGRSEAHHGVLPATPSTSDPTQHQHEGRQRPRLEALAVPHQPGGRELGLLQGVDLGRTRRQRLRVTGAERRAARHPGDLGEQLGVDIDLDLDDPFAGPGRCADPVRAPESAPCLPGPTSTVWTVIPVLRGQLGRRHGIELAGVVRTVRDQHDDLGGRSELRSRLTAGAQPETDGGSVGQGLRARPGPAAAGPRRGPGSTGTSVTAAPAKITSPMRSLIRARRSCPITSLATPSRSVGLEVERSHRTRNVERDDQVDPLGALEPARQHLLRVGPARRASGSSASATRKPGDGRSTEHPTAPAGSQLAGDSGREIAASGAASARARRRATRERDSTSQPAATPAASRRRLQIGSRPRRQVELEAFAPSTAATPPAGAPRPRCPGGRNGPRPQPA